VTEGLGPVIPNWPEGTGQQATWNISVLTPAGALIDGRVWSKQYRAYSVETNGSGSTISEQGFWVVSETGAQYKVDLERFSGGGWSFDSDAFGNVIDPASCLPAYRSLENVINTAEHPSAAPACGPSYNLFFSEPAADLPETAPSASGVLVIKPNYVAPSLHDAAYVRAGGQSHAGTLEYDVSDFTGNHVVRIDTDGNGSFADAVDVNLPQSGTAGQKSLAWDGRDGNGALVGDCTRVNFQVAIEKADEIHFVLGDTELLRGIRVTQLVGSDVGNDVIYWDDSEVPNAGPGAKTSTTTPVVNLGGLSSANGTTHGWTASGANPWGNYAAIDNWAYSPVDITATATSPGTCLDVTKTSDASADTRPGDVVNYTVTATNVGVDDFTATDPAIVADDLTDVLDDAAYNNDATSDLGAAPTYADPRITWSGALPAGDSVTLTYSVTVGDRTGDGVMRNVAWAVDPDDPTVVPDCDPPDADGTDPATGLPCAETENELPGLSISKSANRTDLPAVGDQVEYTVTVTNNGPGDYTAAAPATFSDDLSDVLDDGDLDQASVSATSGTTSYAAPTLSWTGPLAAGQSATVTYSVTYTGAGDNLLTNVACVPTGDSTSSATECDTVTVPGSSLNEWKTATPSSDPLVAGSTITYTLFFDNDGQSAAAIDTVDDLTHVTDDADVTVEPSSPDGLAVSRTGDQISITGSVPAGAVYTVTYTVTIRDDGDRGDDIVSNFLLAPGDPPPTDPECVPSNAQEPDCTTNTVASVVYAKSVSASSDPVVTGTDLTYTITVTNTGTSSAPVNKVDDLTGVIDDATVTGLPVVAGSTTVTASPVIGGIITIGGTIGVGETATITYEVTVNEDDRGDNAADNFLLNAGEQPPTDCVPGSDQCTSTPLSHIVASKSVDPASGSSVVAGDVLTYTLTFTNDGAAAGPVDFTDHLTNVVDDAVVSSGPTVSDPTLTAILAADSIDVTGSLDVGETVTVTYQVTVGADGSRGDNNLGNFLVRGDETPPTDCVPGSVLCTENPVGELHDWKTVVASESPVAAGTELTYTLHFENRGQGTVAVDAVDFLTHVLDDADVTTEPSSGELTVSRNGDVITITGSLDAGESATVTYTVTVKADGLRGDDTAANFLVRNDPTTPPTPPTDPVCQPTDVQEPDCTVTPIGLLDTSKSVSASTDPVDAGTVLTYTLTFDNQSAAAVNVDKVDDLSGVLDDATVTSEPVSSDSALSATRNGDAITVTGQLASGQTVTITYEVTVNEEDDRGDNAADNFLLNPGDTPPTDCLPSDPNCTTTPLPNVSASKSVDPASGSTVQPGDELTYTLTFTNTGEAAGPADRIDHLEFVLDDATWTSGPTVSDPALTAVRNGDDLVIAGDLQPGQTVTVVYSLTVLPDEQRESDSLTNYLLDPQDPPPTEETECEDGTCTENYTPRIVDSKSSDPVSGTPTAAGQDVTYTLHFRNDGDAAGTVAKDDDLTGVLDDADISSPPTSSSPSLTVTPIANGRFAVTGTLQPGESATVTYTVTVRPYAQQGDHVLDNWLVLPGDPPGDPEDCVPVDGEDADCTVHPIGEIAASKSVDPSTGTVVKQGDVLRYTLTFTNTGAGAATLDYVDELGDVLDDATLTTGATSDTQSVTVALSGDTLVIGGSLAPGATALVTYAVTLKAYTAQGDHAVDNFLIGGLDGGDPGECVANDPLCTHNPVSPPPPLAVTGGEIGLAALAASVLLLLGALFTFETVRRRRLVLGLSRPSADADRSSDERG
jgi:fimbrial isopeptide formation D2 family protein